MLAGVNSGKPTKMTNLAKASEGLKKIGTTIGEFLGAVVWAALKALACVIIFILRDC